MSKSAAAAAAAGVYASFTAVPAPEVGSRELVRPLVVYDFADRALASDVKLALCELFGDEAPAVFVCGGTAKRIALYEADRQDLYDMTCALVLPDEPLLEKKKFDLYDFLAIMRRLRAPDGCPWDRVQTHESIRINAIEEAYELVDAIDADDPDKMCEEAGLKGLGNIVLIGKLWAETGFCSEEALDGAIAKVAGKKPEKLEQNRQAIKLGINA